MITMVVSSENTTQTHTFTVSVVETLTNTYTVEAVQDCRGFELNDNDYYESQNKGMNNSFAICKVNLDFDLDGTMYIDCINYAESGYDYGILSKLDTTLTLSHSADSTNVYRNFKSSNSANVQTVTYEVPSGEHFIYIKFIKDTSTNNNNDSLQFKIRIE